MSTARSLNKAMLIGNLTRPPALKKTANGAVVATFGIATNTTWKDSDGNLQERAEFHNIVAWNKLAEICAQILNTGMLVWLEGELRTRAWDDGDSGKKQYRTEVKISDMKLLDAKDKKGVGVDNSYESSDSANTPSSTVNSIKKEDSQKEEVIEDSSLSSDVDDLF